MSTIETGPAPKRGRPPKYDTISETKRIRLRTEVYDRWNEKKRSIEHCHKTHSEFAEFLLDICDGYNDIESRRSMATGSSILGVKSTEVEKESCPQIQKESENMLDVTVVCSKPEENNTCTKIEVVHRTTSESDLDSSSICRLSDVDYTENVSECENENSDENELVEVEMQPFGFVEKDDSETVCQDNKNYVKESMQTYPSVMSTEIQCESNEERYHKIRDKLKDQFCSLCAVKDEHELYNKHFLNTKRVIVDVNVLLPLFQNVCQHDDCTGSSKVTNVKIETGCCQISWQCSKGHLGSWSSSSVLCNKGGKDVYTSSILLAIGVLLTGNDYDKINLFCKFLDLSMVSRSTYMRLQKLYVIPEIKSFWEEMRSGIWQILAKHSVILGGDERKETSSCNLRYCTSILMEQYLDVIVDMNVFEMRENERTSKEMQAFGLKGLLEEIVGKIIKSEIIGDASTSVLALLKNLKDKYPDEYGGLFHSLEIWCTSVELTEKLSKAAKAKDRKVINQWIEPITNHFWHIAENYIGSVKNLKNDWLGITHHVTGEHKWPNGECNHGSLVAKENKKAFLEKDSMAHEAIRKIVHDSNFLTALTNYVHFRRSGKIESFDSVVLKHNMKKTGFQNDSYSARTQLAVIDYNCYLFSNPKESGNKKYPKVYSKARWKNWSLTTVMDEKTYSYAKNLACRVLDQRASDSRTVVRKVNVPVHCSQDVWPSMAWEPS